MAHAFGWAAISDTPMTWTQGALARQLLTEERVGKRLRDLRREEDAEAQSSITSMQMERRR